MSDFENKFDFFYWQFALLRLKKFEPLINSNSYDRTWIIRNILRRCDKIKWVFLEKDVFPEKDLILQVENFCFRLWKVRVVLQVRPFCRLGWVCKFLEHFAASSLFPQNGLLQVEAILQLGQFCKLFLFACLTVLQLICHFAAWCRFPGKGFYFGLGGFANKAVFQVMTVLQLDWFFRKGVLFRKEKVFRNLPIIFINFWNKIQFILLISSKSFIS